MNKAFTREPDESEGRCPHCGGTGIEVGSDTLGQHVTGERLDNLSKSAFFCVTPHCDVAYFDVFERMVLADQLKQPVYPKDPSAPLCPCFGLTRDDIERDIEEGVPRRVRELLAQSKSPQARCVLLSPTGQCCFPEVQKYYMKRRTAQA